MAQRMKNCRKDKKTSGSTVFGILSLHVAHIGIASTSPCVAMFVAPKSEMSPCRVVES